VLRVKADAAGRGPSLAITLLITAKLIDWRDRWSPA